MKCRRQIASSGMAVLVAAFATACGSSNSSTSPTPVPGGGNPQPTSAKIGWSQRAGTLAEATSYNYAVYVDGKTRLPLASVSCGPGTANQMFDCTAGFPQMEAGQHSLELVAADPSGVESPKSSPPLSVTVAANGSVSFDAK